MISDLAKSLPRAELPMYSLSNGSRILSLSLHMHDDGGCNGVVLAEWNQEFVTWSVWTNGDDQSELATSNGHYFHTLREARDDYRARI